MPEPEDADRYEPHRQALSALVQVMPYRVKEEFAAASGKVLNNQLPIAAMMPISTENSGPASLASTVARAGA
ncbi:hypothetical protein [Rhizobium leguminosarum]|uniref:hypothetical protein n=1 Tax=Rhizobium leguminosarum TaxID=384 RepID=UPI001C9495C9|nr:hypothetical protein [Rhizobium leguminosarum]MBY5643693.1 hypothetical protein [Rhizobium leguminosarum]